MKTSRWCFVSFAKVIAGSIFVMKPGFGPCIITGGDRSDIPGISLSTI